MKQKTDNLIPFGYCVVRHTEERALFPAACPSDYFSISGCLCEGVIPDWDCISNLNVEDFSEKWKLGRESAEALFRFNSEHAAGINYMFLLYPDFESARYVKRELFAERDDVFLVGVGSTNPEALQNPDVRRASSFPEGGELLGFDVYNYGCAGKPDFTNGNWSGFGCSIWCIDSGNEIRKRSGTAQNRFGLCETLEDAERVADLINKEKLGEPCEYFPLALIRFNR